MNTLRWILRSFFPASVGLLLFGSTTAPGQGLDFYLDHAAQGYSMLVRMNNWGVFGRQSYPQADSIGLEYPRGTNIEHIFGSGIWIGGLLDTSATGSSPPIKLVSTAYEGYFGPQDEFWPGLADPDTFWIVDGQGSPQPPGWEEYWGSGLPFRSFADNSLHCVYADTGIPVIGHIPLNIRIIQSSFVWDNPTAEAVQIIEYRIMNNGTRTIDSAFVGFFNDGDLGPVGVPNFFQRNFSGYYPNLETAYIDNPIDSGSTPVGVTILDTYSPQDEVSLTFRWYSGNQSPANDIGRYDLLSSGIIDPDQFPEVSDTRTLLGFGPFTIRPSTDLNPDTIIVAFALVSGLDLNQLQEHAANARDIYLNEIVWVGPVESPLPRSLRLYQNYPNPFNPTTEIGFRSPVSGPVSLRIYDVLGREVAMLVNEKLEPGTYKRRWDASGFPSGVYFYRLKAGDFVETKRMLLVR